MLDQLIQGLVHWRRAVVSGGHARSECAAQCLCAIGPCAATPMAGLLRMMAPWAQLPVPPCEELDQAAELWISELAEADEVLLGIFHCQRAGDARRGTFAHAQSNVVLQKFHGSATCFARSLALFWPSWSRMASGALCWPSSKVSRCSSGSRSTPCRFGSGSDAVGAPGTVSECAVPPGTLERTSLLSAATPPPGRLARTDGSGRTRIASPLHARSLRSCGRALDQSSWPQRTRYLQECFTMPKSRRSPAEAAVGRSRSNVKPQKLWCRSCRRALPTRRSQSSAALWCSEGGSSQSWSQGMRCQPDDLPAVWLWNRCEGRPTRKIHGASNRCRRSGPPPGRLRSNRLLWHARI